MKNLWIYILLLSLFLSSCNSKGRFPGFNKTKSGLEYKLHNIGELEAKVNPGQVVLFDLEILALDSSLIYRTTNTDSQIAITYQPAEDAGMLEALGMLLEGDSASFVTNSVNVGKYISFDTNQYKEVLMNISVRRIIDADLWQFEQKYPELLLDYELEEQEQLQELLRGINPKVVQKMDGMYFVTVEEGWGEYPQSWDDVVLHYEGYFLDGKKFDSTRDPGLPFSYTLGEQGQVLMGFDIGVRHMREGGKAIFILPSQFAFNDYGSSTGIIGPYTTLVYEVELLRIIKGEPKN